MLVEVQELAATHSAPSAGDRSAVRRWMLPVSDGVKFAAILLQLVLLTAVIKRYGLESPAFYRITLLTIGGFAVHYFLPLAYRMPFFLALSLVGIVMVMGPISAAWLIALGVGLIAICHLSLPFSTRMTLLLVAVSVLGAMRGGWIFPSAVPLAVWPLLGSMFVFRMMIYLYDVYHHRPPKTVSESLSYFFMLPNVCFPLFPVVDFQAFSKRYFVGDRHDIYQVGVRWIFRGVVQLMIYRILYRTWAISLYEVENAGDLVHYCLWLFLLYLRVSGQFHVIVGMLHLFGFNLPETHHLYFLSSSFTDFWRRINIYWKDFLMRIVFYPAYFQFKSMGTKGALVVATCCVFFMTWLLHAVQWYWLRGSMLLSFQDILFYSILGGFVIVNSLCELKGGQKRIGGASWGEAILIGMRTLATFTVICLLWSMWTSDSLLAWWTMLPAALVAPTADGWLLIAATVIGIAGTAALLARYPKGLGWGEFSFLGESAMRCGLLILLAAVTISRVFPLLGPVGPLIAAARQVGLNRLEMAELERGYYENLLAVDRFNGELWNLYQGRPAAWTNSMVEAGVADTTTDFERHRLKPSVDRIFVNAPFRTNQWGLHDKEYAKQVPAGCYRIALLGASDTMGWGIEREKDFEAVLENKLNQECAAPGTSYEILNFAVAGHLPIRQIYALENRAIEFHPNAIIYVAHSGEAKRAVYDVVSAVRDNVTLPDRYLQDLIAKLEVGRQTPEPILRRKLAPFDNEILSWVFQRLADSCKKANIRPICVFFPEAAGSTSTQVTEGDILIAKKAGFTVVDLTNMYDGYQGPPLWISEWDRHPNVLGHQFMAQRLYDFIRRTDLIPVQKNAKTGSPAPPPSG